MAKTRQPKSDPSKLKSNSPAIISNFDLDKFLDRYIWLIVPVLVLLYYWFSRGSTGFYQDDEIGHYRNIREFWGNPFSIMGNQPKPGWKILMVIPGLLGFPGVALAHCLISAVTVVLTYKLGRILKIRNSTILALLLAAQPLYLQLSFRSYSEITAGLFIVLMLLFYYKDQYVLAALTSSYLFSIRQEMALVSIGLGVLFLMKRRWVPFVLLAWTPLVLALIGWLHTGNMMWLIDDMRRIGIGVSVPHKPFWHYFGTYVFMVGPVTLALLVVGYWSVFYPFKEWKEGVSRHGFLFFTYTIMWAWSVFSAWDLPNFGANPGHWRYLLSIAPLTAIYAGKGLNALFEGKHRWVSFSLLGLLTFITLAFLSRESDGLVLTQQTSYANLFMIVCVLAISGLFAGARIMHGAVYIVLVLLLAVGHTLYAEKPLKLNSEASTAKRVSEWYLSQTGDMQRRPLYCNHVLVRYFADIDINDKNRDHSLQKATLATAAKGSIIIWDSHYGHSQFGGDVPMEYFEQNDGYKLMTQFVADDQRFGALVFEKVK
jgi:hypothetical protein